MENVQSDQCTLIDSFDHNSTVVDVRRQYHSVCAPKDTVWGEMLKRVITSEEAEGNRNEAHQQVLSDMYSRGFAVIEAVLADTNNQTWKLKDYWGITEDSPNGGQTYPTISDALAAACKWHREDPDNREVVISNKALQTLRREEAQSIVPMGDWVNTWRDNNSQKPVKSSSYMAASRL